ncbi:DnaJ-like subfamily C member 13 [Papilio machaon]|uniref:DnaJ-like subfamily C member 13 n=1 Tax=Papilio machaon TaxID=76193 RepID=A0A194QYV1_PAPMA|nr:DnaJ-like subfamily C member 13 [Papilio machaon]
MQHWAQRARSLGVAGAGTGAAVAGGAAGERRERPVLLRRRRECIKSTYNWPLFYYQFHRDHALPNLIWNHTTREELRNALENELRAFTSDREVAGGALTSWNHAELEVHYQCLQNEVKIGDYYLRILLEQRDNDDSPIRKSYEFFNDLYHRFLSTPKVEMKCMCLQAMTIVYGRYYEDIGPFADTKYIVQMLDRTCDRMERDRLVQFLAKLILHKKNVSEILEWNGIRILVELMTLAHLHTSRATVPAQSNVLEAGVQQAGAGEREWYYNLEMPDKVHRKGPVSLQQLKDLYKSGEINNKTKCWANSMEGWRAVGSVPQLKWTLVARGAPVMDESALAATILDLLIVCTRYYPSRDEEDAVIRPLPRVKRILSEPSCLAHVVQLLLTFDPILVEKVATLLYEVMQDNPEISKLYLTGVFYFMLLYTGSNLLPIARFLRLTHMKQAFRADQLWYLLLVLAPYKYAGYPQLLRTARLEVEAEQLFAERDAALLPAACQLAHATVRCSALNAEELRREGGLQGSRGETCARALAALLRAKPALGEVCAQLGELPRLARLLPSCPKHAVPVLAALADTQSCVAALTQTEVMSGLKTAVKTCREVVGTTCEALAAIFNNTNPNTDKLVLQALECELISELLLALESRLEGQAAAQLVGALKGMARSAAHGDRVRALLARSRVWEQYAAQRHDLFISSVPHTHAISAPHAAGYLTAPPASIPAQPPPID